MCDSNTNQDLAQFEVVLRGTFSKNGESLDSLHTRLSDIHQHLRGNGLFTGDSDAELENSSDKVLVVEGEMPSREKMIAHLLAQVQSGNISVDALVAKAVDFGLQSPLDFESEMAYTISEFEGD